MKLVLASKSPRRQSLLRLTGIPFETIEVNVDESFSPLLSPAEIVQGLSERKARYALEQYPHLQDNAVVLSADTIVVIDNSVLNKPQDFSQAVQMLTRLQGRTHEVFTGFALLGAGQVHLDYERTAVTFAPMTQAEIEHYIQTAQPFDKAGSYGIQDDFGACFIERIEGCYYNVVGLPLAKVYRALKAFPALFTNQKTTLAV
ncbi:MAG: Maf family protein [Chloroherpetonaceae bacterium]|nr:Maf family protein [Chloroherpetonaceae bacterium]MCS7211217.1 Maf family protein [Chloroherpetonaceae bacterium]MDW8019968.1 Maf family protein [Chloroherpetonaceae bacterium]MDW8467528.1 Maf family protein [Chloroherpetonaceae bacterium]